MSRGFYNYDTRGTSPATQIVNLERMVEERDNEIERLREALQLLYDNQNGCPLPKYQEDWERAMSMAAELLKSPK